MMKNIFWAALHLISGVGSETLRKLHNYFGDGKIVWNASELELRQSKCLTGKALSELIEFRQSFNIAQLANKFAKYGINICIDGDSEYPPLLQKIFNPPFIFYYQGTLPQKELCIGIVGSRMPTAYGAQAAAMLAKELADAGIVIVSGAAKGIDTKAHLGALQPSMGRTVAVLGCGLDIAYPAENRQLLAAICQRGGAVISEYPLGTKPKPGHFPARNRIISGLARGILVVEATRKSGSLITAEMALSEGRDVFAVPGSIYSMKSQGCHKLIQEGAKLTTGVNDVLEEYNLHQLANCTDLPTVKKTAAQQLTLGDAPTDSKLHDEIKPPMSKAEQAIYDFLSANQQEAKSTDEIIYKLRENVSNIAFILLQMKLKGLIAEPSPNFYVRAIRECII